MTLPLMQIGTTSDYPALKKFLGQYIGAGLTPEEMRHMFLLKLRGNIIGSVAAIPCSNGVFYLTRLKVAKYFRRQGIADFLMQQAFEAVQKGKGHIAFAVTRNEKPARLVTKFGANEITKHVMLEQVPEKWIARYGAEHRYWRWNMQ